MTELDQVWSQMIGNATAQAARNGNKVVLDYLMLRASNDQIRNAGVAWLFDSATAIASAAMSDHRHLRAELFEPHSFRHGNSNLVGRKLSFQLGVRCLSIEAGWTRTPSDGIMRGGSLATARISHFGIPRETMLLQLTLAEPSPVWINVETAAVADSSHLERHFSILLSR
ncbi:MAG TPA: hypothetical protein PKA82_15240 [Pyrinomonadaceae bacterium]|nr:hypothetical protein [Pyrinomonadaceae bacterium]